MYRKFCVIFSQLYPIHSRLVYDPTEKILAILYCEVPHKLPAKYQPNPPGGSGEEVIQMFFLLYMGMAAILNSNHNLFSLEVYNYHIKAKYEISLKLTQHFHRKCLLKIFMNGCHGNHSCHAIFIKTSYL